MIYNPISSLKHYSLIALVFFLGTSTNSKLENTKHAANKIIKNHDEIDITNAIKAVDVYRVNHDVKNPKALINKAIKERWKPDVYKTKKS